MPTPNGTCYFLLSAFMLTICLHVFTQLTEMRSIISFSSIDKFSIRICPLKFEYSFNEGREYKFGFFNSVLGFGISGQLNNFIQKNGCQKSAPIEPLRQVALDRSMVMNMLIVLSCTRPLWNTCLLFGKFEAGFCKKDQYGFYNIGHNSHRSSRSLHRIEYRFT